MDNRRCWCTFADDSVPGIDLIYPDPGFIVAKKDDIFRNYINSCT